MDNKDKIRTLLTSAGMLMEDTSAKLVLQPDEVATSISLLRDTAHDLRVIADAVEVIDRVGRFAG